MDIREAAEQYVWDFMDAHNIPTERVSDTGTVDNLLNDGWTFTEIINGVANRFILDNICWL